MANLSHDANQLAFWRDVKEEVLKVQASVARQSAQPTDGTVFITSVARRSMPEFRPDVVQQATVRIAAQRIVEETHRLSTDEEIAEHLRKGIADKKAADAADANRKGVITFAPKPA